jgi:hypothetical protein
MPQAPTLGPRPFTSPPPAIGSPTTPRARSSDSAPGATPRSGSAPRRRSFADIDAQIRDRLSLVRKPRRLTRASCRGSGATRARQGDPRLDRLRDRSEYLNVRTACQVMRRGPPGRSTSWSTRRPDALKQVPARATRAHANLSQPAASRPALPRQSGRGGGRRLTRSGWRSPRHRPAGAAYEGRPPPALPLAAR